MHCTQSSPHVIATLETNLCTSPKALSIKISSDEVDKHFVNFVSIIAHVVHITFVATCMSRPGLKVGWMTWTIWVTWVTFLVGLTCKLNYLDVTRIFNRSHVL